MPLDKMVYVGVPVVDSRTLFTSLLKLFKKNFKLKFKPETFYDCVCERFVQNELYSGTFYKYKT